MTRPSGSWIVNDNEDQTPNKSQQKSRKTYSIVLHEDSGLKTELALNIEVASNVAELLLDHTDGLEISSTVESVS